MGHRSSAWNHASFREQIAPVACPGRGSRGGRLPISPSSRKPIANLLGALARQQLFIKAEILSTQTSLFVIKFTSRDFDTRNIDAKMMRKASSIAARDPIKRATVFFADSKRLAIRAADAGPDAQRLLATSSWVGSITRTAS